MRPSLAEAAEDQGALETLVHGIIQSLLGDAEHAGTLRDFFAYHLDPIKSEFDFEGEGLHIAYLAQYGVATLRDQLSKSESSTSYRTLKLDNGRGLVPRLRQWVRHGRTPSHLVPGFADAQALTYAPNAIDKCCEGNPGGRARRPAALAQPNLALARD